MLDRVAVAAQQNVQATVAEVPPLQRLGHQPIAQGRVVRPWSTGSAPRFGPGQSPGSPAARSLMCRP